jgi:hypothetical protein
MVKIYLKIIFSITKKYLDKKMKDPRLNKQNSIEDNASSQHLYSRPSTSSTSGAHQPQQYRRLENINQAPSESHEVQSQFFE